jgi:hypothetical protein
MADIGTDIPTLPLDVQGGLLALIANVVAQTQQHEAVIRFEPMTTQVSVEISG